MRRHRTDATDARHRERNPRGEIDVTFDGTTCPATTRSGDTDADPAPVAGLYRVPYTGPAGAPSSVTMAGAQAPKRWSDLVAWIATIDLATQGEPPAWVLTGPSVADAFGTGTPMSLAGAMPAATVGPVCASGMWPDLAFVPGTPFEVAVGP